MNTIFYGVVTEEKERNRERLEAYKEEIEKLPKGYLVTRKSGNKVYYYLQYRKGEGDNKVAIYLKQGTDIEEVKKQIAKRKHYEGLIKKLELEYKQMCKVVKDAKE